MERLKANMGPVKRRQINILKTGGKQNSTIDYNQLNGIDDTSLIE